MNENKFITYIRFPKKRYFILAVFFGLLFSFSHSALAQSACGNIITFYDYGDGLTEEPTPIEDCDNPFNADSPEPFIAVFNIEDQLVANGTLVTVPEDKPTKGTFSITNVQSELENYSFEPLSIYQKVGSDYRYVTGTADETFTIPTLEEGEYIAVLQFQEPPILEAKTTPLWQRIFQVFLPATAYAYIPDYVQVVTISFTITHNPLEPQGASNILFLPGIQASRLYKDNLIGGGNDQVWPPNAVFNEDIYDLAMDSDGASKEYIYTEGIMENAPGGDPVYAGFKNFLDQLDGEGVIEDWESYAYDWRYSVTDIAQNGTRDSGTLKDAIVEIERLAETSHSGKVTVVGHSNGGLLAKAIVRRLELEGKADLVDTVVLLASPQLGTPKAIGTILHGYDQTDPFGGLFMDGHVVREIINNFPGVYGLLPSEKYFEGLDVPLVTFSDSVATAQYRQVYGSEITLYVDYLRFLRGEDGIDRDLENPISTPAKVNGSMLEGAILSHKDVLDNWTAPSGVQVVEVVGTGLSTLNSIEYRSITEDKCASAGPVGIICKTESYIKPYAVFSKYGDATVMQRSAEAYSGEKQKYFVNLNELNNGTQHYNITEALPVQNLLEDIILGAAIENNQFISSAYTQFNHEYDIEMIDSPVRILATDLEGNQTGVTFVDGIKTVRADIPGSQYFEFGSTKYLIVPKETDRITRLYGEDYGGYTLTTATLNRDDVQSIKTQLSNASTTPVMFAEYSNIDGLFSTMTVDVDGDGGFDYETTLEGDLVEREVTYALLVSKIEALTLSKAHKRALLILVKAAELYESKTPTKPLYLKLEDTFLKSATELIKVYLKKQRITAVDGSILLGMIQSLENKH